jgi:hypothetical protein
MIVLVHYARRKGHLVSLQWFRDDQRDLAENARLALELSLEDRNNDSEVVLLDAENEEALRRTHRRYFETIEQLMEGSSPSPVR